MPSTPSYLLTRSLHAPSATARPSTLAALEHINISAIDTPTRSLRHEILIGFLPCDPYSLVTLSRPEKSSHRGSSQLRLWEFHPQTRVKLLRNFRVDEEPDYLPIAVASCCFVRGEGEQFYQVLYRSAGEDGEACIEVRWVPFVGKGWSVWECVVEEDGLLGGICFSLLSRGYITVATASRVYFFTGQEQRQTTTGKDGEEDGQEHVLPTKETWWTFGKRCLIFEVDLYLQRHLPSRTTKYATRIIPSTVAAHLPNTRSSTADVSCPLNSLSIIVFASQKSSVQSFKLEITPSSRDVKITAQTDPVNWKSEAKGALLAWSMGRKLMTGHCCEDECPHKKTGLSRGGYPAECTGKTAGAKHLVDGEDGVEVFKSWFARGKGSLKELVWDYGGVVLDSWDG